MGGALAPDVKRIGRPPGPAAADRAPAWVAQGTPAALRSRLELAVGERQVRARAIDLVAYASDASPYRTIPRAVVRARDSADVQAVLAVCAEQGVPLNFRGAGTSISGQAQCDGVIVDVRRHMRAVEILDGGARVRVEPGAIVGHINRLIESSGHLLGPDPGSKEIATIGGVIANNSGGMRCGTEWDPYSTVESMRIVLADGSEIDTAAADAEQHFSAAAPELAAGLLALRERLLADSALAERVRAKFRIKNTTGYRLCALLDAETPLEIFRRLIIGSEGTLAFVASAVMRTRPEPRHKTVAWLHFPTIDAATAPVSELVGAGARASELMVGAALIAAAWNMPGTPEYWRELPIESGALIVEFGAEDPVELREAEDAARAIIDRHELIHPYEFRSDPEHQEMTWRVREGLFGLVGGLRPAGTSLIVEDVCVAPERIAACAHDLQALLGAHGYLPGVAGHASAGNLHFQLTPNFDVAADLERYHDFMGQLVELVVGKYDGSLKAEHGTGRNMAPYVESEWGPELTAMMWEIKRLADPEGLLNPDSVLSRDPEIHLRALIGQPAIEDSVSHCVECGYCEPVCPSRDLTLTPRQRIVVRREMARQEEHSPVLESLLTEFEYDGIETCAADGACRLVCPVGIDTGEFIRELRTAERSEPEQRIAGATARSWRMLERATRAALEHPGAARAVAERLRRAGGPERIPLPPDVPPARALPATRRKGTAAVYLPACVNRMFGYDADRFGPSLPAALVAVSARAGKPLWIPEDVAGVCCATPFSSKGYGEARERMSQRTREALSRWSEQGSLPVVIDASSCALGLRELAADSGITVFDSVDWVHDQVLEHLVLDEPVASAALHVSCAAGHLELAPKLAAIAGRLAREVTVTTPGACCGMAGDRGLLHPELTEAALEPVAEELAARPCGEHLSSNRTCEIALTGVTGEQFASFVLLLERQSRSTPIPRPA
jgi:D-lactate dehydrogenase